MSKYISIIFLILVLIFCPINYNLSNLAVFYNGTFYVYTYQYFENSFSNITKNGKSNIIECETKNAQKLLKLLDKTKITGMSFCFEGNQNDLNKIMENTKLCVKYSEKVENIQFYYGFSPLFDDYTLYNNEKINIQIAFKDNNISVGVPLILGSI